MALATFHQHGFGRLLGAGAGPGFAEQTAEIPSRRMKPVTVELHLAPVVTDSSRDGHAKPGPQLSPRTPRSRLSAAQLEVMQPVAASEALRFLPGAVIDTQGRRGGLASLFVRGGDSRYNKVIVDGVPVDEPGGTFDFGVLPIGRNRASGIRAGRAKHALRLGRHDQRGADLDPRREHTVSGTALRRRRRQL